MRRKAVLLAERKRSRTARADSGRPLRGQRAEGRATAQLVTDGHAEEPAWTGDIKQARGRAPVCRDRLELPARSVEALGEHARRGSEPEADGVTRPKSRTADAVELGGERGGRRIRGGHDRPRRAGSALGQGPRGGGRASDGETHRSVRTGHAAEPSARGAFGLRRGLL